MNKRIHLRKKIILFDRKKKTNIFVVTAIFLVACLILVFNFINKKVSPVILNYAELEARKLATLVINSAISKNISNKINFKLISIILYIY